MSEAYKTEIPTLAELETYVGKELGLTDWIKIEQESVNTFATLTGDEQWIHTNPELSKKYSPYGKTVAHGFYVLSMASQIAEKSYSIGDAAMGVNYGLDKVRFPNATPVGGEIRGRTELMEYKEIPGGARFKMKITFELKGDEKPVCVAEFIAQIYANAAQRKAFDELMAKENA